MSSYRINEVDATDPDEAHTIRRFNAMMPEWPAIEDHHLQRGYWWLIHCDFGFGRPVGFAGMVPFTPFLGVGYLKRCYVEHRGAGLQTLAIQTREEKARRLGWKQLVSETTSIPSAANFRKLQYSEIIPEQKWGEPESLYFTKSL